MQMQGLRRGATGRQACGSSSSSSSCVRPAAAAARGRRSVRVRAAALDPETVTTAAYATLAAAGAGFVGTFFVAPQFKEAFKEDVDWREIYRALQQEGGVKQLDAREAAAAARSGAAILLDVRLANKFDALHAEGSLSAPLYLPIQQWDVASIIRRLGFAFFGIYGTELNTSFGDEVQAKLPKGKEIVVLCETGGSLENKSGTKFGFQSRSLKAAYYLRQAGFTQVAYVAGGLPAWSRQGLPMAEGPEDLSAVPALSMPTEPERAAAASPLRDLLGGLKLPELSFLPSRR